MATRDGTAKTAMGGVCRVTYPITAILPTRKRPIQLQMAISSLLDCSPDILVWVYVHADDKDTFEKIERFIPNDRVKYHVGPPRKFDELGLTHTELAKFGESPFVWFFNDDAYVTAGTVRVAELKPGIIYMPEYHRLGGSHYHFDQSCPFFIIPNGSWRECGEPQIGNPVDLFTLSLLRKHGYETRFIPGLEVWHDRNEKNCSKINDVKL